VKVQVFDVTGRFVKTLVNDRVYHRVLTLTWDGTNEKGEVASTGIYFIKAQAGSQQGCKKVLVLR
jgi:flagellar hook assembly protein FlgD